MAIRGLYEKYLAKLANESFENERVWATTDERVGFSVYEQENGEVLSVQEDMLTVQGTGVVEFRYCKDGTCQSVRVDFKDESVKNITI